MSKIKILLFFVYASFYGQNIKSDFVITKNNDTIYGKIQKITNTKISIISDKGVLIKDYIKKLDDINISDLSILNNPLNLKIEKPQKGFSHIYFYRPYNKYGKQLDCKIKYNGKKFINVKNDSYYLHKVKANEVHKYFLKAKPYKYKGSSNNNKSSLIKINAKGGEIYFIKSYETYPPFYQYREGEAKDVISYNIVLDNPKIAKYIILAINNKIGN